MVCGPDAVNPSTVRRWSIDLQAETELSMLKRASDAHAIPENEGGLEELVGVDQRKEMRAELG